MLRIKIAPWLLLLLLTSCATQSEYPPCDSPDPGESIWEAYADEIAMLAKPGTPKAKWDMTTDPEYITRVSESHEVSAILSPYENISEEELKYFMQLFETAHSTTHYGLEGNFKALVFFDAEDLTIDAVLMSN